MYTEVTFTSDDGSHIKKYMVVAKNVYDRNKIVAELIDELRIVWGSSPLFNLYELEWCYNKLAG